MDADDGPEYSDRGEIWRRTSSFYGASFIWAALGNFGGNNGMYGDLALVRNRSDLVLQDSPTVAGFGIAMEGIDQNPAYYTFALTRGWSADDGQAPQTQHSTNPSSDPAVGDPEVVSWLKEWGVTRCGKKLQEVEDAYGLLGETVYEAGQAHEMHHIYINEGSARLFTLSHVWHTTQHF
jgi:alpha-N-acetylglucosaminidase